MKAKCSRKDVSVECVISGLTRCGTGAALQDGVDIKLLQDIELDRSNDDVYSATTTVISSVMNMTQTATDKNVHLYVPLVKFHSPVHASRFSRYGTVHLYGVLELTMVAGGCSLVAL